MVVYGGIWESDRTRVFRLDVNLIDTYTMTEADELWVQSLVKNLIAKGGRVAKHHVFIRTNGIFTVSDQKSEGAVYINRNDPDVGVVLVLVEVAFRNHVRDPAAIRTDGHTGERTDSQNVFHCHGALLLSSEPLRDG